MTAPGVASNLKEEVPDTLDTPSTESTSEAICRVAVILEFIAAFSATLTQLKSVEHVANPGLQRPEEW